MTNRTVVAKLSVIVPVLNEVGRIEVLLRTLKSHSGDDVFITVVDGGSTDNTVLRAQSLADSVITADRGRACQMIAGASGSEGDLLWFLHADCQPNSLALSHLLELATTHAGREYWGRFDVAIDNSFWMYRIIETTMNWRSRATSVATGDQGIFVSRNLYQRVGGYRKIALMEDIELSKRLRACRKPLCLPRLIVTSARRWQEQGILQTMLSMWTYRLLYWLGVSTDRLARWYYPARF